jgi:phage terminase large subunit-like protein
MPFDKVAADRAIRFIESLKHTKGKWAGVRFKLTRWQRDRIIRPLFGTLDEDGNRQHRSAFIQIPRKNGKSELEAAIALKLLFADGEQGGEIYSAAADRDQASLVFNVADGMVRQHPLLRKRAKIIDSSKRIVVHKTQSFYRAIPADAAGSHGFNAHGILPDELHVWPKRDLWDALTTSTGAREQPLTVTITTPGWDHNTIWGEQYEYARKVRDGVVDDPTHLVVIYEPPQGYNWRSERVWRRCNPAIGSGFRNLAEMRALAKKALHTPALQNTFRRLYIGDPNTQSADRWIDLSLWDANAGTIDEERLRGRKCYGGLDLGAVNDLTAWVMVFPRDDDEEEVDVLARFWCPEARLRDPSNRYADAYQEWKRQGWLMTTPGDAIDYAAVKQQIVKDASTFQLVDMNVDRLFQAHQLAMQLQDELGEERVVGMGQGFLSMAAPMHTFHERLLGRRIHHGGNGVLRWMADNVAVKQDPAGNLKISKADSQAKVDGMVALVMALDRAMRHEEKRSRYEDEGAGIVAV